MNLSSRIEGLTKFFGVSLIISEETYKHLTLSYPLRYIGSVIVKGKQKAIKLYEVMNKTNYEAFQKVEEEYNRAIEAFENKEYDKALKLFSDIESHHPHQTHRLYIDKLTKQNPITQAFVMESK